MALSARRVCGHCCTLLLKRIYHGISQEEAQARLIAKASVDAGAVEIWEGPQQQAERVVERLAPAAR